jgi:hypothetical protein
VENRQAIAQQMQAVRIRQCEAHCGLHRPLGEMPVLKTSRLYAAQIVKEHYEYRRIVTQARAGCRKNQ